MVVCDGCGDLLVIDVFIDVVMGMMKVAVVGYCGVKGFYSMVICKIIKIFKMG